MEEKEVTSLQDRGGVKYEINSEVGFTGKYVESYKDGQKKVEKHYKDGKLDGLSTHWDENGQKDNEANYKNGEFEGLWTKWYENGKKKEEENYKDGKREGLKTKWDENGQKESEANYKNGKLDGLLKTSWYENGQKKSEGIYKVYNKIGRWTTWYESGQKESEGKYKDDKKIGGWTTWYESGQKYAEADFKDGVLDGKYLILLEHGQKKSESNWIKGSIRGVVTTWNDKGEVVFNKSCFDEHPDFYDCLDKSKRGSILAQYSLVKLYFQYNHMGGPFVDEESEGKTLKYKLEEEGYSEVEINRLTKLCGEYSSQSINFGVVRAGVSINKFLRTLEKFKDVRRVDYESMNDENWAYPGEYSEVIYKGTKPYFILISSYGISIKGDCENNFLYANTNKGGGNTFSSVRFLKIGLSDLKYELLDHYKKFPADAEDRSFDDAFLKEAFLINTINMERIDSSFYSGSCLHDDGNHDCRVKSEQGEVEK